MSSLLLGDDGRGYELARKLESHGVWRSWLGEPLYSAFIHSLSSPSAWDSFMRSDSGSAEADGSKTRLHLQLRARALLFDKASLSLSLRSDIPAAHSSALISKLTPNYLQLHGDDVYFTLENGAVDGAQQREGVSGSSSALTKVPSKSNFGVGSRYSESEADAMSQKSKLDDFPETWYNQFFEKYRASKSYRVQFGDRDAGKRTPEQMSFYLRFVQYHKRRRIAFKVDPNIGFGMLDDGSNLQSNSDSEDNPFFPETMSVMNCVPESAVPRTNQVKQNLKMEFNGVLDTLPQIMTKSHINPIMIERLGIRPEYLSMEQGSNLGKGGAERTRKCLSKEQAFQLSQKVMAQLLRNVGFDGSSEVPLEVLTKFLSCHICKLGGILKHLADSYRKQHSAVELIRMFLHTAGHSNLAVLSELVKDNTRTIVQPTPQQMQGFQQQLQPQHQAAIRQSQQILRMHPQMQQLINPQNLQNLTLQQQQQLERLRRRQQLTPRPGMAMNVNIDKDRPLVEVKLEQPTDFPMDNNAFNAMAARQPHMQQQILNRQQQMAAMSSMSSPYAQNANQFRPMTPHQIPQVQSPNMGMARAPPVKVEGFQELMGGDATMKHDPEEHKLMSPQK